MNQAPETEEPHCAGKKRLLGILLPGRNMKGKVSTTGGIGI